MRLAGHIVDLWLSNLRQTTDDQVVDMPDSTEARASRLSWVVTLTVVVIALLVGGLFLLRDSLRSYPSEYSYPAPPSLACYATQSCLWVGSLGRWVDPYMSCKRLGLSRLSRRFSTPLDPTEAALAWARRYTNRNHDIRQRAMRDCRRGLVSG